MRNDITLTNINMSESIQMESPEKKGKEAYLEAGADYVISSLVELKEMIKKINARIEFRERRES
jgi:2-methylisocitrate lyase-like PEP mutase family enzyme